MAKPQKEEKSPLLEKVDVSVPRPDYSEDEIKYISGIRKRMEDAQKERDRGHDEFDGMNYVTQYESNERMANTFVQPKINKEDTNFQSGIIRQKLFTLLSALVNLDLRGDISAFDKDGFEVQAMGDAMEDIIQKTDEMDVDDEKKYLRHYELLKHGTVFVEEIWDEKYKKSKKTTKKFDGKFKGFDFKKEIKKAFSRPTRNIVPGINVYLGNMREYEISKQPFIFTVDVVPYQEAERMFGEWDRWENVPKKIQKFSPSQKEGIFKHEWTLLQSSEGYVEILRYQDKPNNEYALILNGVLMTPVGLPLTDVWGYEDYNITQQNLEPIHAKFAYGKSLVSRIKNKTALLDELMRLAILKTQKSFMPPYLNVSGRVVSNRVFMPGKISYGIPPNTLIPISDKEVQGVTTSELAMIQEIQESINSETTSPTFQGQQAEGRPTATEIIELQRQAKMVLGLTIFSVSMLEWKITWLRLKNILANWFQPEDEVVDKARSKLRTIYRKTSTDQMIEGEGMGKRIIIPTKEIPSSEAIMRTEDRLSEERGMPIRLIFIDPEEVTSSNLIWWIAVVPKEKRTSEVNKLLFRAFMQDIMPLGPNIGYLREKAASVWEENPSKLFAQEPIQPGEMGEEQPSQPGQEQGQGKTLSPRVNLPQPEKLASKQLRNNIQMGM